jgi:hypothetical protein
MLGQRLSIYVPGISFRANEMGRHFHDNGITVNKTIQTVEIATSGATIRLEDTHNPALLFHYSACGAPR